MIRLLVRVLVLIAVLISVLIAMLKAALLASHPDAPISMVAVLAAGDAALMGPGCAQAPSRTATDKALDVRRVSMVNS